MQKNIEVEIRSLIAKNQCDNLLRFFKKEEFGKKFEYYKNNWKKLIK